MNSYSLWKYILMLLALIFGCLYTLPNLFGEIPAVQISSNSLTSDTIDEFIAEKVKKIIIDNNIYIKKIVTKNSSMYVQVNDINTQLSLRDILEKNLNSSHFSDSDYTISLSLQRSYPEWLSVFHAIPIYLGLDLQGGIHFLLQMDISHIIQKRLEFSVNTANILFNEHQYECHARKFSNSVIIDVSKLDYTNKIIDLLRNNIKELNWIVEKNINNSYQVIGSFNLEKKKEFQEKAIQRNIATLYKRINAFGIAEAIIHREGIDRIVVEIPGIQDIAKAKDIIGRTATLEARLVSPNGLSPNLLDPIPDGDELFIKGNFSPILLKKQIIFNGDNIIDSYVGFDDNNSPAVNIKLDSSGSHSIRNVSKNNLGHPMAIVLFDKDKSEILTVAKIYSELSSRFQITGNFTSKSANNLALLLRSGSLSAPMNIIEEKTIGPSLGIENIKKGFNSIIYGFIAISLFMIAYYMLFGFFSVICLFVNLILLLAILSILQATLTLPGIAAIALTLGMAIDANVLINERIREELRRNRNPNFAIQYGYKYAWTTIFDSNITTLIAGFSLFIFGSGPIKGFGIIHCLGIITSLFSSVFFSRGLINLWCKNKNRLNSLPIGKIWRK